MGAVLESWVAPKGLLVAVPDSAGANGVAPWVAPKGFLGALVVEAVAKGLAEVVVVVVAAPKRPLAVEGALAAAGAPKRPAEGVKALLGSEVAGAPAGAPKSVLGVMVGAASGGGAAAPAGAPKRALAGAAVVLVSEARLNENVGAGAANPKGLLALDVCEGVPKRGFGASEEVVEGMGGIP